MVTKRIFKHLEDDSNCNKEDEIEKMLAKLPHKLRADIMTATQG